METVPLEILLQITEHLSDQELAACCAVCHLWRNVFNNDLLWKHRCDQYLEEPLKSTPCVVHPMCTIPEREFSFLRPIGKWRAAFMRQTHLYNNWRTGNFLETEIERIKHSLYIGNTFLNYFMLVMFTTEIELWDVRVMPPVLLSSVFYFTNGTNNFKNLKIVGSDRFLIVVGASVQLYQVDQTNSLTLVNVFVFDETEKMCPPFSEIDLRAKICRQECSMNLNHAVADNIFCGIVNTPNTLSKVLHVWDLESGNKIKEVPCPLENVPSASFHQLIMSEDSKDILTVVQLETRGNVSYYVFSSETLEFLPFTHEAMFHAISYCKLNDGILGLADGIGYKIFNYRTSQLLFVASKGSMAYFIDNCISVIVNDVLHMYCASTKTMKLIQPPLPRCRVDQVGGRFIALIDEHHREEHRTIFKEVKRAFRDIAITFDRPLKEITTNQSLTKGFRSFNNGPQRRALMYFW